MPEELTPSDIATVLRRLRKGDKALLDKKKALADLGYGSVKNVEEEVDAANNYRRSKRMPDLDMANPTVDVVKSLGRGGRYYPASDTIQTPTESQRHRPQVGLESVSGINELTEFTPEGVLGHELTHAITNSDTYKVRKLGHGRKPYEEGQLDPSVISSSGVQQPASEVNMKRVTYPEYDPTEFAPPLAAMTRLEYQKTGKRIDTPEKFDKKVAEYDAMSSKEKLAFKKNLPVEVRRFYNYMDAVTDPKAEDVYMWGPLFNLNEQGEMNIRRRGADEAGGIRPIKIKGKDRRKRFLDISREMIPSLVEKEDSFEEAVNRRMS